LRSPSAGPAGDFYDVDLGPDTPQKAPPVSKVIFVPEAHVSGGDAARRNKLHKLACREDLYVIAEGLIEPGTGGVLGSLAGARFGALAQVSSRTLFGFEREPFYVLALLAIASNHGHSFHYRGYSKVAEPVLSMVGALAGVCGLVDVRTYLSPRQNVVDMLHCVLSISELAQEAWGRVSRPFLDAPAEEIAKHVDAFTKPGRNGFCQATGKHLLDLLDRETYRIHFTFVFDALATQLKNLDAYKAIGRATLVGRATLGRTLSIHEPAADLQDVMRMRNGPAAEIVLAVLDLVRDSGKSVYVTVGATHVSGLAKEIGSRRPSVPMAVVGSLEWYHKTVRPRKSEASWVQALEEIDPTSFDAMIAERQQAHSLSADWQMVSSDEDDDDSLVITERSRSSSPRNDPMTPS
jgi:hypothetical protein